MKKSARFHPIQQLTERRQQEAAQALGKSNQVVSEQEQRLSELQQYRLEYQRYVLQQGQGGITAARLMELQRFLHSLDQAISQQQNTLERVCAEREKKRQLWQQAHGKSVAMAKVVERFREDEAYLEARREQKEADEYSQRGKRGDN